MYGTLPFTCPSRVPLALPVAFAMPKSRRRATPSEPTMMFWGETSRWMMLSGLPAASVVSCAA